MKSTIVQITDKDAGDEIISMIPIEKYPFADSIWALKARFFSGQYLLSVQIDELEDIEGIMLYSINGDVCNIVIMYAPNLLLGAYKELWKRFELVIGNNIKKFRWWTSFPKQFARMTGAKELYTMMELERKET